MERGSLVLGKLNNHEYIIDDPEEQKHNSSSSDAIVISIEERIDMFKYFMGKYEFFDRGVMCDYLYMTEFLTILHPKEFSFITLYEAIGEGVEFENGDADILKELLLHIKKFFKRRNLTPKPGYLKEILKAFDQESSYFTVLEIIFTISFMCKDVYSLIDYPKEFFTSSLSGISESYNPVSLSNTMEIVNCVLNF